MESAELEMLIFSFLSFLFLEDWLLVSGHRSE
jgi:hypothetical protein